MLQLLFHFVADPCYHYKNLSDANRKISYVPPFQSCVTNNSPRDGIVLWELQEQKCQQHVCQHIDVVQPGLAG